MAAIRNWMLALLLLAAIAGCSRESPDSPSNGQPASSGASGTNTRGQAGAAFSEPVETPDLNAEPAGIVTLELEVDDESIQMLDSSPFSSQDVIGAFVDDSKTRYPLVYVNYRGSFALLNLLNSHSGQRNWKVKFPKDKMYRNRREWNFNYEPDIRQRLSYRLMQLAGVKAPIARHVLLRVNGKLKGLFLEYEDPDNKTFLAERFGSDKGDLYKAAFDIPGRPRFFAALEYLGDNNSDYYHHYRKMTNNGDPAAAADYSRLREFLAALNQTGDGELESVMRRMFNVESFISYLVVANYIGYWDGYPQRPKNFWLYQNPASARWNFIPWDMDSTFQPYKTGFNPMGTDASVFCQFDRFLDYHSRHKEETMARPLVTRLMKVDAFRSAYVARYRQALATFLNKDYLLKQVDLLSDLLVASAYPDEVRRINYSREEIKRFIARRSSSIVAELEEPVTDEELLFMLESF